MTALVRPADLPAPHPITLPSGSTLAAIVARVRRLGRDARPATPPTPAPVPEPAPVTTPLSFVILLAALRGYTLPELAAEATRLAQEAAAYRSEVEGLCCGRTYGDRRLTAIEPAPWLTPALAEATRRADMAGALADLVRGLVGREPALAEAYQPPSAAPAARTEPPRPLKPGTLGLWTPSMRDEGFPHVTEALAPRNPGAEA